MRAASRSLWGHRHLDGTKVESEAPSTSRLEVYSPVLLMHPGKRSGSPQQLSDDRSEMSELHCGA